MFGMLRVTLIHDFYRPYMPIGMLHVSPIDGATSPLFPLPRFNPKYMLAWPNIWWNTQGTRSSEIQGIWDAGMLGLIWPKARIHLSLPLHLMCYHV